MINNQVTDKSTKLTKQTAIMVVKYVILALQFDKLSSLLKTYN